ncbi:hypothetical protein Xkhy_07880 [Xanthomonas axonopodis pv. khayae]|nr:hypothetical protein Xmar_04040 [Xanthomonas axonopodis pv. martyniicola]OOW97446.1 hypothetical protein Xvtr_04540 [Xanthomonas campestris pv. vitiscarnosae]OOX00222.1 hypothetical protein Xkhy_07880 [Xanthomonas axonopodis pv. khayae]PNV29872.1 hypothetical protein xavtCFBP7764_04865 [Xanthomonas citri]
MRGARAVIRNWLQLQATSLRWILRSSVATALEGVMHVEMRCVGGQRSGCCVAPAWLAPRQAARRAPLTANPPGSALWRAD